MVAMTSIKVRLTMVRSCQTGVDSFSIFCCHILTYREVCDFKEEGEESNDEKNQLLEKNPVDVVLNVPENMCFLYLQTIICANLLKTIFTSAWLISPVLSINNFQSWISYSKSCLFPVTSQSYRSLCISPRMTLPRYSTPIPSPSIAINSFVKPCSAKTMWQTWGRVLFTKLQVDMPVCQMDSKPGQIHRQTPGSILVAGSTSFHRRWIRSLGKMLLESLVRKRRRWRYIQDSVRCRRAMDCSPAQSLPRSTHPPQSRKAKRF